MIPYGRRLKFAFRTFFSILDHGRVPDDVAAELGVRRAEPVPAPVSVLPAAVQPPPVQAAESADRAIQMLSLLQRGGRLIDFLMEDLTPYPDAQIGSAVRDVHAGTRQALERYISLSPIIDDEEGRPVIVDRGTDPASVKVVGAIAGAPPLRGVLRHRGWEATRVDLPPLSATGRTIVAPAEVEVS